MNGVAAWGWKAVAVVAWLAAPAVVAAPAAAANPKLSLCPGFTIVTAITETDRDYESIKTIESVDAAGVRLRYSSELMVSDWLNPGPPQLKKTLTYRTMRHEDLDSAVLYLQHFGEQLPETVPETTAISVSRALFRALTTQGSAEFGVFIPFNVDEPGIDRDQHPNIYDNQMVATVTRTGEAPRFKVTLNDREVELSSVGFQGDFYGDRAEFFVLDDPEFPLMLKFRIGIDANRPLTPEEIQMRELLGMPTAISPDKEALQVVEIVSPCASEATGPAADIAAAALEAAIADAGRAEVQAIFFTVDSAELRPESDPALAAIADLLGRHPEWRVSLEGHTDGQADETHNLDLSQRRAEAVKTALIERFAIAAGRLATVGFGESRPVADNATLEGRARNRRVELVKLP